MYLAVRICKTKLHLIAILDTHGYMGIFIFIAWSSDHAPLSFVFDFNSTPTFIDPCTCLSNRTNFNWADYKYLTRIYCKDIHVDDVVKCSDVNCKSHDHLKQIDDFAIMFCIKTC